MSKAKPIHKGILNEVKLTSFRVKEGWVLRVDVPKSLSVHPGHIKSSSSGKSVLIGMCDNEGGSWEKLTG